MLFKIGMNKVGISTKLNVLTMLLIDPVHDINFVGKLWNF